MQFLSLVRIARTDQIERLCFPSRQTCYRRLCKLLQAGVLHREPLPGRGYFWALRPVRYTLKTRHDLAITEVYVQHRPLEWRMDVTVAGLKPDAAMRTKQGTWLIEVDCGTTAPCVIQRKLRKYEKALSGVEDAPKVMIIHA